MKIRITVGEQKELLCYAVKELKMLLCRFTPVQFTDAEEQADKTVMLAVDASLAKQDYQLCGGENQLAITGGSASAVLCGVYEALDHAGMFFGPNGYSAPKGFDLQAFFDICREVSPKCRLRGIRQHINFPMDISSYTLKDAKEYIRNLARMRMNAITFHSYGGQWHVCSPDRQGEYAGNFFYGQRHPVPEGDPVTAKRIENRKVYCIPEAEAIYDDLPARDSYAKYWLREVMQAAKDAYMTVTLSVELPFDDAESLGKMLHEVCVTYPQIDTLELISYECAENCPITITEQNLPQVTRQLLGDKAFNEKGELDGYRGGVPWSYGGAMVCFKRMLTAIDSRESWMKGLSHMPKLRAGMYLTNHDALRMMLPIMRRMLPEDVSMSFLPAHGSVAAAESVADMQLIPSDWQNTMLYSWAEFDGNMYIEQQASDGIYALLTQPEADSIYGLCINHWRTAENQLAICYAADAMIHPAATRAYYARYAEKLGIADIDRFVEAADRMAKLDTFCRDNLFNVGFCFVGCWINRNGLTLVRKYETDALQRAIGEFEALAGVFAGLLPGAASEEAIAFVRLMENRCKCSVLHLHCMDEMAAVKEQLEGYEAAYANSGELPALTEAETKRLQIACHNALVYAGQYLHLYGEMMPDRGAEGTLVSYYETLPVYIRELFGAYLPGIAQTKADDTFDAPPIPQEIQ